MMEDYFAHSEKHGCPPQSYDRHITDTTKLALRFGNAIKPYCRKDAAQIENILHLSAAYHDLGKLDEKNQALLHKKGEKAGHLPVNHVDAGAAFLKQMEQDALCSLMLVSAHHRGLPNSIAEEGRQEEACFRDERKTVKNYVDQELDQLIRTHRNWISETGAHVPEHCEGDTSMFIRMMMSCLADADHSDTASVYRRFPESKDVPELQPARRLEALNRYVENHMDAEQARWYEACRDFEQTDGIVSYDSFGNAEKMIAAMAYQLNQAISKNARRIFVVLPYTDKITQAVEVYRNALGLPGERAETVVANVHCERGFESKDMRDLAALWRAPIIVTTTVFFFKTLASNRPGTLRRLHELPGSIILVDEIHAALPLKLLPLVWRWMEILEADWGCHWILASGFPVQFWKIPELVDAEEKQVLELVNPQMCRDLPGHEKKHIQFLWRPQALGREELMDWVMEKAGPRIVIMNTVQNAAVVAHDIRKKYGRKYVEHLSPALMPVDYEKTMEKIKKRLSEPKDKNWVLVTTSCVETVSDLSFRTGFREMASVLSVLQAAGNFNGNKDCGDAELWSFHMQDDIMLYSDPRIKASAGLLKEYLQDGMEITPELGMRSMKDALQKGKLETKTMQRLIEAEEVLDFQTVNDLFRVDEEDMVSVVVNPVVAEQFRNGSGNWRDLWRWSVSIPRKDLGRWQVEQLTKKVYDWTLPYDSFLGCMAGVLDKLEARMTEMQISRGNRAK